MEKSLFSAALQSQKPIHLAGIGGVSMKSLAEYFHNLGCTVQGSDRTETPATRALAQKGIKIFYNHDAANVNGVSMVIKTAAIGRQNPEIAEAAALNIPIFERAEAWGFIMEKYKNALCIAGTHGKTSTTAMMSSVALAAKTDPTIMIGGHFPPIGGAFRQGKPDLFIAESCEYMDSFLHFAPTVAAILNLELEHTDYFPSLNAIIESFTRFASLVPERGCIVANIDDDNVKKVIAGVANKKILSFGLASGDVFLGNLKEEKGLYSFDIIHDSHIYAQVALKVPGRHSMLNALATAACSIAVGISGEDFKAGIEGYSGVGRRLEFIKIHNGASVYSDYSHHPTEITACLTTAKAMDFNRVICVFQPHTYSRTAQLMEGFAAALSLADKVILCPIYAAREDPIEGVTSAALSKLIPRSQSADSLEDAATAINGIAHEGDIVIVMGAGDVEKIFAML